MLRFLLCRGWLLAAFLGQVTLGLLRLEPTTVYKDFGQKLAFNQTFTATADGETLAVCTSHIFPHDRLPFPGSQAKCDGKSMQIVALFEMEEAYVIGCCAPLGNHTHRLFRCPVPPLHDANPLLALVSNDLRPVHYAINDEEWHRGEQAIEYAHGNRLDGVIRATTTLFAVAFAVGCGIAVVATHVHEWANKHPWVFVARHITGTILFVATMVALFLDVPDDAPLKASVVHLRCRRLSPPSLSTPLPTATTPRTRDSPFGTGAVTSCATPPPTGSCSAPSSTLSPSIPWPTWWSRFEAPFDVLFFFLMVSMLTLCTFCVAFTTSLYGVHEPLRIGDGTVVLGDTFAKVASEARRRLFYDYERKCWAARPPALRPGTVVAMDAALRGWRVGTFDEGRLHLSEHAMGSAGQHDRAALRSRPRCSLPWPRRCGGGCPLLRGRLPVFRAGRKSLRRWPSPDLPHWALLHPRGTCACSAILVTAGTS